MSVIRVNIKNCKYEKALRLMRCKPHPMLIITLICSLLLASAALAQSPKKITAHTKRLTKVHKDIIKDFPEVKHISRDGLQTWLAEDDPNIVILDTRPVPEYRISHIEGAIQINPKSEANKLSALDLNDKTVIVYCSVGRRSSALATRLEAALEQAGAQTVLNLEGGLFGWHNDGRDLVNANGPTDIIHPYNGFWGGRYLTRKNKTAYSLK